jgi:hypothetical protein
MLFFAFSAFYCCLTLAAWSSSHWLSLGTASQAHDECIDCQTTEERHAVYKPYYEQSYAENSSVLSFMLTQPPWLPERISGSSTRLAWRTILSDRNEGFVGPVPVIPCPASGASRASYDAWQKVYQSPCWQPLALRQRRSPQQATASH